MRRRLIGMFYGVGLLLSMAAIGHAGYGFFMETSYFKLRDKDGISILGVGPEISAEVMELVKSQLPYGRNLLKLDSTKLAKLISMHPRISNVKVTKVYPDKVYIEASERNAGAIISSVDSNFYLVDWNSYIMERLPLEKLGEYDLPLITGVRADNIQVGEKLFQQSLSKALDLILMTKERNSEFYDNLSEVAILTDGVSPLETITAKMKQGLEVFFGDGNPVDKLAEYESMVGKIRSDKLDPYKDIVYIELRYKGMGFYLDRETMLMEETKVLPEAQQAIELERQRLEEEANKIRKNSVASDSIGSSSGKKSSPAKTPTSRSNTALYNAPPGAGRTVNTNTQNAQAGQYQQYSQQPQYQQPQQAYRQQQYVQPNRQQYYQQPRGQVQQPYQNQYQNYQYQTGR